MSISRLFNLITNGDYRRVTYYTSPTEVTKITRYRKKDKRSRGESFVLTHGKPNFLERKFIKDAVKAGVSFPIRKLQLKCFKG